ncbi:DUF2971 domain-containing protein [Streptomyces sp. NPDC051597]|uniref:DUF2971 domain-containing protein n=1 Tax=Streptomyces sp. NPDC051597 TaxID=3155049 RepID=UPI0034199588
MPSSDSSGSHQAASLAELEVITAQRSESNDLYHYTNANVAMYNILASGTLRLSPFESTNDLWESRPLHPVLSCHHEDTGWLDNAGSMSLWADIDRHIRLHTKVACLTRDFTLPDHVWNRDAWRGWGHLSLWAHYGAGHTGICLRFDRTRLIEAFLEQTDAAAMRFHNSVAYVPTQGAGPNDLDIGQIREFGVDAAALAYAEANQDSLFFRKYWDWENEAEYRLVLLDQSLLPAYIDIRSALTGVILGDAFPAGRRPALHEILQAYPEVEVHQLQFHNRRLMCFPPSPEVAVEGVPWAQPRRSGSLQERLGALRDATAKANELRPAAVQLAAEHLAFIGEAIAELCSELGSWPEVEAKAYPHPQAVPEEQRARMPGVSGEQVHHEGGSMCVVENLPKGSLTLVAAAALQVLDDQRLRLHWMVTIELPGPQGNGLTGHWRDARVITSDEAASTLPSFIAQLRTAVRAARPDFDSQRQALKNGLP